MGTNLTKTINETVNINVNKATILAQQDIIQTNQQNTNVNQVIDVVIDGKLTCASFELNNDAKVNAKSMSQASSEQKQSMAALVHQALASEAKNEVAQANSGFPILQTNAAIVINRAINATTTEQETSMIQTFEAVIEQSSNVTQTIKFRVTETAEVVVAGACTFNNTTSVEYTAQMVTNAAIDVVLAQETVQEAITEWETAIKQSNDLSLGAILGIVIAIIIVIIIIAVMAKFLPPYLAKKRAEKAASGK